jgi:hypothetical protein
MSDVQTMQLFCVSDPLYYETPDRLADSTSRFAPNAGPIPAGWRRSDQGLWTKLNPDPTALPEQGWKIHLSTIPERAKATLDAATEICVPRSVPFKFLRSADALRFANGKHMSRASSGKFITIYPADENQLGDLLRVLLEALDGEPGPYILSDLRIGRGPVHVRYGAFVERWCVGPSGALVPALRDPSGVLVPDVRRPVFRVPPWVRVPDVLRPHVAARAAAADPTFPYRVLRALHFTNSGGTYLAEHRSTGERVVLREARPHSGVDRDGADASARLRREHDTLVALRGLDCVPRVYGIRTVWEHQFLIEEYIEGDVLMNAVIYRHPLRFVAPSADSVGTYLRWVEKITNGLSRALDELHARGISFGDLHPGNVIVRPDDSVVLVDFEYASDASRNRWPRVGAAGLTAPHGATGVEADRYALRSTWLMMLTPMVEVTEFDPGKAATLEEFARRRFGLGPEAGPPRPEIRVAEPVREQSGEDVVVRLFADPATHWPAIRRQLVAGIMNAATPERTDRLFPADPAVFHGQCAALAHGAAGVLLALHRAGADVPEEHVDWLVAAARRTEPRPDHGLYNGLYGTAVVLDYLERPDDALETLARCRDVPGAPATGLYSGSSGVALALCHFARVTGDDSLIDEAVRTAERLDTLVRTGRDETMTPLSTVGLLHGMSGAALLNVHLYRMTGEEHHLHACRRALHHELSQCVPMEDGTMQVRDGHRHLLYLDRGSGGIALVAREYLAHRDDPMLANFVRAVRRGCCHELVREPGLFHGRAGFLAVLGALSGPAERDEVLAQVGRLALHAVHREGALMIPGAWLRRFSADLATGSAGVLLALHSVFADNTDLLSLLPPG